MLGNEEDKNKEPAEEQIIGLDLNVEQATITYLSYERSIGEAEEAIKEFKHIRTLPIAERPEELKDPQVLNDNINIANFTLGHLRYLHGEVKTILLELAPPEKGESTIIKSPNWDKKE